MNKSFSSRIKSISFCVALLVLLYSLCSYAALPDHTKARTTLSAESIESEQQNFDTFTEHIFQQQVASNTINLHYTLSDPAAYGIDSYDISLGDLSEEGLAQSIMDFENWKAGLENFDYGALTTSQQLTYDLLTDYIDTELSITPLNLYAEILKPSTGTQTEIPVLLAEYSFHDEQDVTDYLALLDQIDTLFEQIIAFEQRKSDAGLFMSDTSVDTIIEECNDFTANPEGNFLIDTFNTKIDQLSTLSDISRETYKMENETAVIHTVIPAYRELSSSLSELKGTGKNEAGLCNFSAGKAYYEYLVKTSTGSDKVIEKLEQEITQQRQSDLVNLNNLYSQNPDLVYESSDYEPDVSDPAAILYQLQDKMKDDFPPITTSNFSINYVDQSLENYLAPAFYITAPLDDLNHNVIYINENSNYDQMQLFTTLAHEGYPGHLYQTTESYSYGLAPIRAVMNYPGYVEGWATYVEMLSYHYANISDNLANALQLNRSAMLSLYASVDIGIHYNGWNLTDVGNFLDDYGITNDASIEQLYHLIVAEPAHYLEYYVGYLEFLELKDYAIHEFGEDYNDKDFHAAIIQIGPAPFNVLRDYLKDYY